ncbi:Protein mini spindles [Formica fusca]
MMPFLTDIDNLKMTKIKECADNAVMLVKMTGDMKRQERSNTAPAEMESQQANKASKDNLKNAKSKRPYTATAKKSVAKIFGGASSLMYLASSTKKAIQTDTEELNRRIRGYICRQQEINEMAAQLLPVEVITGLVDSNWKTRLAAVTQLSDTIKMMDSTEVSAEVFVRTLANEPGFRDPNFQVLKLRIEIVKYLAENHRFTVIAADFCLLDIMKKLRNAKNCSIATETLLAIAETTSFQYVADEIVEEVFYEKDPKLQQKALLWLCRGVTEFGCNLNIKFIIEKIKKIITATNPGVRTAAVKLLGTLYLYIGRPLLMFFEKEKPALRQQIKQECERRNGETPPMPIRGAKARKVNAVTAKDEDAEESLSEKRVSGSEPDLELISRVDIYSQIIEALRAELADKNCKVRNEALQKVNPLLSEANALLSEANALLSKANALLGNAEFIEPTIGDLPQGLALHLVDSNSKIAQTTLGICEMLATAIGPPIK